MSLWDTVVSSASKAVTQAGEATQVAATKAKLHADMLVIDRDIHARKEIFGVDMYAHLEKLTSTQEFYVADDKLINIIRPTLIKAQREVAAYEKKRDTMRGKVSIAEVNRSSTGSILTAETFGQKFFNAASFISAGAKEAACKTELAMLERQIRGFKEEFGVDLYPVFQGMEDNEGWLPTDRKVRSLYDQAREDIAKMENAKEEKREHIRNLDRVEGRGLTSPHIPFQPASTPAVIATHVPTKNYQVENGQTSTWADAASPNMISVADSSLVSYGSSQHHSKENYSVAYPSQNSFEFIQPSQQIQKSIPTSHFSTLGFMQTDTSGGESTSVPLGGAQHNGLNSFQQEYAHQVTSQNNFNATVFDPFEGLTSKITTTNQMNPSQFDPCSSGNPNLSGSTLSDADVNLFKY